MIGVGYPVDIYRVYKSYSAEQTLKKLDEFEKILSASVITLDSVNRISKDLALLKDDLSQKLLNKYSSIDAYYRISYNTQQIAMLQLSLNKVEVLIKKIAVIIKAISIKKISFKDIFLPNNNSNINTDNGLNTLNKDVLKIIFNYLYVSEILPLRRVNKFWRENIDNRPITDTYILLPRRVSSKATIINLAAFNNHLTCKEYVSLLNISKSSNYYPGFVKNNILNVSLRNNLHRLQRKHDISNSLIMKVDDTEKEVVKNNTLKKNY